jgi:hypothetical protein
VAPLGGPVHGGNSGPWPSSRADARVVFMIHGK